MCKRIGKYAAVLGLMLLSTGIFAQQKILKGNLRDSHSEEVIPFASVYFKGTSIGKVSDSAGLFSFIFSQWPGDTLMITCVGYQPYYYIVDHSKDTATATILMQRGTFNEGVVIRTKFNKGLYLWKKIVQNKPRNDRYRFDNFSYELYNKLELDIKNINFDKITRIKPLRPLGDIINPKIDSTTPIPFLPAYLTEALSDYYYQKKPLKRREVIRAANTNGIENESMVKFLGGMDQNINVYNNFISVFDRQFVSPASDNGDMYYSYRVPDTQRVNNQKFYHLVFTPRRKGTNTFEGDCWVQSGTFAIQKMNLRLGKEANINMVEELSLIQEYQLINDSVWFLAKDKFVADVKPVGKNMPGFITRKTTTYRKVKINDSTVNKELAKNKLLEEVITLPGATEKDRNYWSESRHETLTHTEAGIISMIDSFLASPKIQSLNKKAQFIGTGYLNVGNIAIGPWFNWVTANAQEGYRVRWDISSNTKFDKHWWYHGYAAYGFGDKKLKGKAELFYLPSKHPRHYLYASYSNDLDIGQSYYGEVTYDNIFALAVRKPNIPLKYIKIEEKRFEAFNEHRSGFSEFLWTSHRSYTPLRNLPPRDSFPSLAGGSSFKTYEIGLRLRFAYLERFLENAFFRTSIGSAYPIGEITIAQGLPHVFNSQYKYTKVSCSISDYLKIPPYGSLSYQAYMGRTFGTLPYMFLDIAPGNEMYYYNKYAFNMMNRYEFIHDNYAGINIEHNVGNGLFRFFPKLKLRQFWTAKTYWGSLTEANKQLNFNKGNYFQTLNGKTYLELGTGIDNILRVFRVDFIWRVLPVSLDKGTTKNFGIFGSFRLAF